jgi:hypothetical protein
MQRQAPGDCLDHQARPKTLGEWVALEGDEVVAHGADGKAVYESARAQGISSPFLFHVSEPDSTPFAGGWLGSNSEMPTLNFDVDYAYHETPDGILIPLQILHGRTTVDRASRLDTGAADRVLDRFFGEVVGIDVDSGMRQVYRTVAGSFVAYGHEVTGRADRQLCRTNFRP